MRSDMLSTDSSSMPPRAGIALLTLQLRAALQEADTAERHDASGDQLRARLDLLMNERRRALDAALDQARSEAAASVSAAQRAAKVIVTMASSPAHGVRNVEPTTNEVVVPVVEPGAPIEMVVPVAAAIDLAAPNAEVAPIVAPIDLAPPTAEVAPLMVEVIEPVGLVVTPTDTLVLPIREVATDLPDVAMPTTATTVMTIDQPGQLTRVQPTSNVVIDAEAFATVFATVVASLLEERFSGMSVGTAVGPAPAPAKQSFWTYAVAPRCDSVGARHRRSCSWFSLHGWPEPWT